MTLRDLDSVEIEVRREVVSTSARVYGAAAPVATMILAHGAGAPQTHPWMVAMSKLLAERGLEVVTFNFLYKELDRGLPDKKEILEATYLAVIAEVRRRAPKQPLFIGGKSMGGRIATQIAVDGALALSGIVLLGYPLHPPDKPQQLRDKHLADVKAPMLFVQGTRDEFGTPDELNPYLPKLIKGSRLFPIEGGDHSLTRKKSVESPEATMSRVADEVALFVSQSKR